MLLWGLTWNYFYYSFQITGFVIRCILLLKTRFCAMESVLWWQWPCASCLENTDLSPVAADEGKGGIFTFKPTFFWHYQKSVFLGSLWCEPTKSGVGQWLGVSPPCLQAMLSLLGADRASLSKGMSQKKLCSSSLAYFWLLLFDFNLEKNNPARQINTESILVTTIFFFFISCMRAEIISTVQYRKEQSDEKSRRLIQTMHG